MNVAIIGCGLIGEKRAKSLGNHKLVVVADHVLGKAESFAKRHGPDIAFFSDWKKAVRSPEVDIVIIATTNNSLAAITLYAVQHDKHVIVEKPAGRNAEELRPIIEELTKSQSKVKVGFNLRFHPGIRKAKEIIDSGVLGELMFVRGRYGHGGRIGYDREWRADFNIAGGGELIDQGVHLIDLSRWILGEFSNIEGHFDTYYWDMSVEDNAFVSLRTPQNKTAWLHVSCTEWKNTFSYEIYGKNGKLHIEGLGGSYGVEKLTYYKMLPEMGPPDTTSWEYPGNDKSWDMEFAAFVEAIQNDDIVCGNIFDAYETLKIVDKVYGGKFK